MLTYRLVHLIEYHSDSLASSLLHKVQNSERTPSYRNVPTVDLKQQVFDIYHHLGSWLMDKEDGEVEQRYTAVGARRAEQNVPLSELVWAIILTKHNLWDFIEDVSFPNRITDVSEKQELLQLLDQFFDQAIHAAVVGFEWAAEEKLRKEDQPRKAS
jgi:hypothetical protein